MSAPDHAQVQELIKCGRDPVYFTKTYTKIQHPKKGTIQFKTFPYQDDCLRAFKENRFNIVLKARQLGLSTVTAAFAVWLAFFHKDKSILVIATKLPTAINFIKKVKFMLDAMPPWMHRLCSYSDNKQQVSFSNGSFIKAIPTSEDAGRSEALSLCIIDEAAHIRDLTELWKGLYPTLSAGGSAVLLSTPNGAQGLYYDIWVAAEAGDNEFNTIRLPWDVHPDRDEAWFANETKNMDKRSINQELQCEFLASGDTFLSVDDLEYVRCNTIPPIERSGEKGTTWTWRRPEPNKKYVLSADVARGDSKDFSAFCIFDCESKDIVVEFVGKIPPDVFGDIINEYGKKYNDALAIIERNVYGYMTIQALKKHKYKRLYYETASGDIFNYKPKFPSEENKIGFDTNAKTRPLIMAKLEEMIRNRVIVPRSTRLSEQLKTFVFINNKPQASRGHNDDIVMATALGAWFLSNDVVENEVDLEMMQAMLSATKAHAKDVSNTPLGAAFGSMLPGMKSRFNPQFMNNFGRSVNIVDPTNPLSGFNIRDLLK